MPTIKKRRRDHAAYSPIRSSRKHQQPLSPCQASMEERVFPRVYGSYDNDCPQDVGAHKLASTLKFEQRSGSSQCKLAWNVPNTKQLTASVTDIHLQMLSRPDYKESPSAHERYEDKNAWYSDENGCDKVCVKGRQCSVPLQSAKDRLR